MAKNEVVFMEIYCVKTRQLFHQRYDFAADDKWALTYGIKDSEFVHMDSRYKSNKKKVDFSKLRTGPQYRCPYCGNDDFVKCGRCHNLTCYSGDGLFECVSCGRTGEVHGTIDSVEGSQGDAQ